MKTKLCKPILVENKKSIELNSIVLHPTFGLGIIILESLELCYYNQHKSGGSFTSPVYNVEDKLINQQLILVSFDSDGEIEEGDFIYDKTTNSIRKAINNTEGFKDYSFTFYKIIATQEQLSPEYIQQFIEEYNEGNVNDIEIEMEYNEDRIVNGIDIGDYSPKFTDGFINIIDKDQLSRKIYNNGFYDYYYKCQDCGCESISLKHPGGFQHADLICDNCGIKVINNKIQIEANSDDNWEAELAIQNIPELPHVINSVKELRRYYIDGIQVGYEKRKSEESKFYTEEEVLDLLIGIEENGHISCQHSVRNQIKIWFDQNKKK